MAFAEPPQQTSSTTHGDEAQSAVTNGDEGQSAVSFKSPPHHRLPPKKRRFDFDFDFDFDFNFFNASFGYIKEEEKSQDDGEGDRVSHPESDATSIHPQPVPEDFRDVSSKRLRTGGAVEKGFIKNYVMSRAFNAPVPITIVKPEQQQEGEYKFKCKTCNKRFPTYQALGGHISNHNYQNSKLTINPCPTTNLNLSPNHVSVDPHEYRFKCKTCNKSFPTHRALGGHRSSHYDDIKGKMILSATANDNGVVGDHRCNICDMSFPTGRALGGHKRLHWVKPSAAQDSASTSLSEGEMGCKMFDTDHQMEGADGINLELTL